MVVDARELATQRFTGFLLQSPATPHRYSCKTKRLTDNDLMEVAELTAML